MSLFTSEEEKTLSFDEYMTSFDTNQIAKVQQFIDWLGQYRDELVHNPWGEVNPDLEIVRPDFDAAQVRRNNLMAYLLPRLGRSKIFVVAPVHLIRCAMPTVFSYIPTPAAAPTRSASD